MSTQLTEEEMRRALFGKSEPTAPAKHTHGQALPDLVTSEARVAAKKTEVSKGFTTRLRVTLRVGNEFEGNMHETVHEVNTLSSLVAEQEAIRIAKKKFRFVEVLSVKSI